MSAATKQVGDKLYRVHRTEELAEDIDGGRQSLNEVIAARVDAAEAVMEKFRGPHAVRFRRWFNDIQNATVSLMGELREHGAITAAFPEEAHVSPMGDSVYDNSHAEFPDGADNENEVAADTATLRDLVSLLSTQEQNGTIQNAADTVSTESLTAEVAERMTVGELSDDPNWTDEMIETAQHNPGDIPFSDNFQPAEVSEVFTLPNLSGEGSEIRSQSEELAVWVAAVAEEVDAAEAEGIPLAESDELNLLAEHPELAPYFVQEDEYGIGTDDGGQTITVEEGDTAWDLAEEHLGDPTRWPELFEANKDTVQPDGRTWTDPDLIVPGWQLQIPGEGPTSPGDAGNSDEVQWTHDAALAVVQAEDGQFITVSHDSEEISNGEITMEGLQIVADDPDAPAHVRDAAQHLLDYPHVIEQVVRLSNPSSFDVDLATAQFTATDIEAYLALGFDNEGQAQTAAHQAANRVDELLLETYPDDVSVEDLDALFSDIQQGMVDPTFAATFSERVGVDGYNNLMTLLQYTYMQDDDRMPPEGIQHAWTLGQTMTTALDTLDGVPDDERLDPSNADLEDHERISAEFALDVAGGYDPEAAYDAIQEQMHEQAASGEEGEPYPYVMAGAYQADAYRNLGILMSFTRPPTWIAVDLANNRLSPELGEYSDTGTDNTAWFWGEDLAGFNTNYAMMLARHPDASASWLNSTAPGMDGTNLERVILHDSQTDADGGAALGIVVESGLTHPDARLPVPGAPSYVEGGLVREHLMEVAIDTTAQVGELKNPHLNLAFAAGVETNAHILDERINEPFNHNLGQAPDEAIDRYQATHDFLREVVRVPEAAVRVEDAFATYGMEEVAAIPDDASDEDRSRRLEELGTMRAVLTEAITNADVGAAIEDLRSRAEAAEEGGLSPGPTVGTTLNQFVFDRIPVYGTFNGYARWLGVSTGQGIDAGLEWLIGELGEEEEFDALDEAEQRARVNRLRASLERGIWLATELYESDPAIRESVQDEPFVNDDGTIRDYDEMVEADDGSANAYMNWIFELRGNRQDRGPLYEDMLVLSAGVALTQEGATDLRDRR